MFLYLNAGSILMIFFSMVPMVGETWTNGKDAGMCLTIGSVFLVFLFDL